MTRLRLPLLMVRPIALVSLAALAGCGPRGDDGPVTVSAIGSNPVLADPARGALDTPARLLLDATAQGLVRFDASGQIEPGIAERWSVIDQGRSYIFRLRDSEWNDGERVTAAEVVKVLRRQLAPGSHNVLSPLSDRNRRNRRDDARGDRDPPEAAASGPSETVRAARTCDFSHSATRRKWPVSGDRAARSQCLAAPRLRPRAQPGRRRGRTLCRRQYPFDWRTRGTRHRSLRAARGATCHRRYFHRLAACRAYPDRAHQPTARSSGWRVRPGDCQPGRRARRSRQSRGHRSGI